MRKNILAVVLCLISIHSAPAFAEDTTDAYDPFIDYNEFEVADEEEADINFFRHGRFLTMGFLLGQRGFTEGMADIYKKDVSYGLYLSYFFDLRFALQFGFITGSHKVSIPGQNVSGDMKLNGISVDLKYYINTQNVTKGLAVFNPYFIGGFTSFTRETVIDGQPEFGKDSAMAFDAGVGIEFPILRNKMYVGAQTMYQLVNFRDENTEIKLNNGNTPTNKFANGDIITILAILE